MRGVSVRVRFRVLAGVLDLRMGYVLLKEDGGLGS